MNFIVDKEKSSPRELYIMLIVVLMTHTWGIGWGLLSIPVIAAISSFKLSRR